MSDAVYNAALNVLTSGGGATEIPNTSGLLIAAGLFMLLAVIMGVVHADATGKHQKEEETGVSIEHAKNLGTAAAISAGVAAVLVIAYGADLQQQYSGYFYRIPKYLGEVGYTNIRPDRK